MARWCSKKAKQKYSSDIQKLGFIPSHYLLVRAVKYPFQDLEECDFDDECNYCNIPKKGSFASVSRGCDFAEVDYYICGKCASRLAYKSALGEQWRYSSYSNFNEYKRKANLKDGESICKCCNNIHTNECSCELSA